MPPIILYGSIFSELFGIVRCTLRINDFIPRAFGLILRMIAEMGMKETLTKQLEKTFRCFKSVFQKFGKTHDCKEINITIIKNTQ